MTDELKVKPAKRVSVRVLSATPKAALVEYDDRGLKRATIPSTALDGERVEIAALEAGIPYGLPWEDVQFSQPSRAALAHALRAAGIWTKQDLFANPNKAIGALQAIYSVDLAALIQFAEQAGKGK